MDNTRSAVKGSEPRLSALRTVRAGIASAGLLLLAVFGAALIVAMIVRTWLGAGEDVYWVYGAIFIAWIVAFLVQPRLSLTARSMAIIGPLVIGGTVALVDRGLAGHGALALLVAVIVATVLLGVRAGASTLFLAMLIELAVGLAFVTGTLALDVEIGPYLVTTRAWAGRLVTLALLAGTVLVIVWRFQQSFLAAIDDLEDRQRELSDSNRALEAQIEERRRVEAELGRIQFSIDRCQTAVFWLDAEGRLRYANLAAARCLGYARDELLGMGLEEIEAGWTRDSWERRLQRLRESHLATDEQSYVGKHGETVPVEVTAHYGSFEAEEYVFVFCRDISDRLVMRRDQERLAQQLRQSQKMEAVGQLAGGVAHDFNNLLQAIQGHTELALSSVSPSSSTGQNLSDVLEASKRAAALIQQLLAFSRQAPSRREPLELNGLVGGMAKMLDRVIGEDVIVELRLDSDLPPIEADAGQVEQIVLNLCVNARDAMPDGGRIEIVTEAVPGPPRARAETEQPSGESGSDRVRLQVCDNGSGIAEELQDRVFEPFFTTKDTGKGTGLGLSTVYAIAEQHGAELLLDSHPGAGTTVTLVFDAIDAHPASGEEASRTLPADRSRYDVLVAEDDDVLSRLAVTILERAGHRVVVARDGSEAVTRFLDHGDPLQVVVLDVVMPRKSGPEVFAALREERPDVAVVFCSGYEAERLDPALLQLPGVRRLQKPYRAADLLEAVRAAVEETACAEGAVKGRAAS